MKKLMEVEIDQTISYLRHDPHDEPEEVRVNWTPMSKRLSNTCDTKTMSDQLAYSNVAFTQKNLGIVMTKRIDPVNLDINQFYQINDIQIPWTILAKDARERVQHLPAIPDFLGMPSDAVSCQSAFGMKTIEVSLRGPRANAAILQVAYELAPEDAHAKNVDPSFWVRQLEALFGLPKTEQIASYEVHPERSGRVIYSQKWELDNVRITLSTFGGYRTNNAGETSIAGLFIDWTNELLIAEPFLQQVLQLEQTIEVDRDNLRAADIVKLKTELSPYYVPDYALAEPHAAMQNKALRRAQRAIRMPQIFDTPADIADILCSHSVLIWSTKDSAAHVLSTKWDSVIIHQQAAKNKISHTNLLPAKGKGYSYISANGLSFSDVHSSPGIGKLASMLGDIQQKKVSCRTDYDC